MRGSILSPRGDRNRFVASTIIEVSDLRRFVADPAKGVDVVGGIDSPEWGYRPFVDGSATVTAGDAGRWSSSKRPSASTMKTSAS